MKEEEVQVYNLIDSIPKVYEQIFNYLGVKSLCNACLVCTSWCGFIASSSSFMNKAHVKIRLRNIQHAQETADIIRKSKRKLFHLEIAYENDFEGRIREFWDPERGVLSCPLVDYFQHNSKLLKNLTSLNITTAEASEVTNILKATANLKHLKLKAMRWTEQDWLEIVTAPIFSLITLEISSDSVTLSCHQGLHHFLQTQIDCLERFTMTRGVLDADCLKAVTKMKRLKYWEIREAVCGTIDVSGDLKSLEELKAYDESGVVENVALLKSIPNLKKLSLENLNQRAIETIGTNLKNLREVHAKTLDFNDITNPDLFPALELIKIEDFIDFSIQEAILQQVADGPTHFTQCLYDEICKPPHIIWE